MTDADVDGLRQRLAAGDTPRVVVRTASAAVAAGTRGSVVRIGDPREGEYVVVRLGRDEVPFAPSELSLPVRGRGAAAAAAARPKPKPVETAPPAPPAERRAASRRAPSRTLATPNATTATTAQPARRSSGRRSAGQTLVVTLRFVDDVWTVEAQRGARRLARATPVRPGAVKAFAELVDDEAVRSALLESVESSRAVIAAGAAALRAELAAAEASLREYEARAARAR